MFVGNPVNEGLHFTGWTRTFRKQLIWLCGENTNKRAI